MLSVYDQIPEERRTILDATGRLDGNVGDLADTLIVWAARDDTRADPEARRAANTAMDAVVDAMLAELHQLRARLVTEIRVSDDATAQRVDQLLARGRGTP